MDSPTQDRDEGNSQEIRGRKYQQTTQNQNQAQNHINQFKLEKKNGGFKKW